MAYEVLTKINDKTIAIAIKTAGMNRRAARPLNLLGERLIGLTD